MIPEWVHRLLASLLMALIAYAVCTFSTKPILELILSTPFYNRIPCTDASVMIIQVVTPEYTLLCCPSPE